MLVPACVLGVLVGAGCGPNVTVSRSGGVYPSKPQNCALRWENLDYFTAMSRYEAIGNIRLSGDSSLAELDHETKGLIQSKACDLGADVLVLGSAVTQTGAFGAEAGSVHVMVFRNRDANSPPPSPMFPPPPAPATGAP